MLSIPTVSITSSWQPLIIKQLGSVTGRKHVNSRVKRLSGAKPCVFFGWGRRSRVSVSAGSGLELAKLSTKSAQD